MLLSFSLFYYNYNFKVQIKYEKINDTKYVISVALCPKSAKQVKEPNEKGVGHRIVVSKFVRGVCR